VLIDCKEVKESVTEIITSKNEEIQKAKNDSEEEKKNVDRNIIKFNNSKKEAEASLQTISQKVEAIDKYIQGKDKSDYYSCCDHSTPSMWL